MREYIRDLFRFSQKELAGILILLLVSGILQVIIYRMNHLPLSSLTAEEWGKAESAAVVFENDLKRRETNRRLFSFDPNRLPADSLQMLGIPSFLAIRIERYRNKGGCFKEPEDLLNIYGFDTFAFFRLFPYIRIASDSVVSADSGPVVSTPLVNINLADSFDLIRIKGIGKVLSSRIIRYREALGGFYSTHQLREVYGIDDERYEQIRSCITCTGPVKTISISTCDEQMLRSHPYLSWKEAKQIIRYRNAHDSIMSPADLYKIPSLDSARMVRLQVYLTP